MVDRRKFRRRNPPAWASGPEPEESTTEAMAAEAERQAQLEAEQQAKAEAERQARLEAEQEARAEAERQARLEAEQQAAAEAERQAQLEAEQEARAEAERQARLEAEQQAKAEAERQAQLKAEQEARIEAERIEAERKAAIAGARKARLESKRKAREPLAEEADADSAEAPPSATLSPDQIRESWARLGEFAVDARHLERNRIVTAERHDPAHAAFDILRTRLLQALSEHGWKRVAITSPTKDCGKTFTAANLAISLSRQRVCRTLLLDCDLRRPTLHKVMGVRDPGSMGDMLRGTEAPESHLRRMGKNSIDAGENIAFGFNGVAEPYAAELLQEPRSAEVLRQIEARLAPDVILFDLPPALYFDDVMAFREQFDGVLLVIGGGMTTEKEVHEVQRRLGETTPLLGTVLNKAEDTKLKKYTY